MEEGPQRKKLKRNAYDLQFKTEVISLLKTGKSQLEVANILKISRNSVKTIWGSRDKTSEAFVNKKRDTKRVKPAKYDELDKALFQWFRSVRAQNEGISGQAVKDKALVFAATLGHGEFSASNGWFDGWAKRHDIVFGKVNGEGGSCDIESAQDWLDNKWPVIRAGYSDDDIFNADETGFFFQVAPDSTYREKSDNKKGKKKKKQRVTLLVCANMSGSEKSKLLMIGQSKRPRPFPKDQSQLPVHYFSNKMAWMTSDIFESWLKDWDKKLKKSKRKILLLVDNVSSHKIIPGLENIHLEFFPPNLTALLQPMDQGIIRSVKAYYRRFLLDFKLNNIEIKGEAGEINLLNAVYMIENAWKSVKITTIKNCFSHAKLTSEISDLEELDSFQKSFDAENQSLIQQYLKKINLDENEISMDDYIDVGKDVPTCGELTDEEIIASVLNNPEVEVESEEESNEIEISDPQINSATVIDYVSKIRAWMATKNFSSEAHNHLSSLQNMIVEHNISTRVQVKITDYFRND